MDYCKDRLKADCEMLLSRFQQTESVRYELFLTIWKEMKFQSIFYGKMENNLRRLFSREVLATAYTYFLPPYTFQIRVGALYLLYGLYHCQLSTPKEKTRLALKDWEEVNKFQQDAVSAQHFDVVYIIRQLISQKAFYFTVMPTPLIFNVKKSNKNSRSFCEDFLERAARPQELVSMDMLEELANVHEHYEQVKASISAKPGQPDPSINLIHKNLVPRLHNTVVGFYNWQKAQGSEDRGDGDSGEGTSNKQESSQRAQLLASIKSKSYGQIVEASKARRHRQVERDEVVLAKETSHHKRLKSLKQRTSHLTQGAAREEALKTTSLWCMSQLETQETTEKKKKRKFKW
ncbi:snRNA-activating protein complex subunit 1b [Oncorhynchus kisutch]|uniref:Small nuclear RNA activating complex, polypeptide 1b n=1 Tax=Oncorhynchus kisutch TaxID=8019 RepID=A0A8C7JWA5_ONCKI|nr:snRNA-activating protein complex subunit 1 [Oncorhynchus kisutch]